MTTLCRKVQRDYDRRHAVGISPHAAKAKAARKPAPRRVAAPVDYPGGRRQHAVDIRTARRKADRKRRKLEAKADTRQAQDILSRNVEARTFVKGLIFLQSRESGRRRRQMANRSKAHGDG